jgi:trans-aconitate 2-methyltransferase
MLPRATFDAPRDIVDLGCGTAMVTALLRARWLDARGRRHRQLAAMIDRDRVALPGATWELDDLAAWTLPVPVDLIVSNAALQ